MDATQVHFQINWVPGIGRWRMNTTEMFSENPPVVVDMEHATFKRMLQYAAMAALGDVKPKADSEHHEHLRIVPVGDKWEWKIFQSREVVQGQHKMGVKLINIDNSITFTLDKKQTGDMLVYMAKLISSKEQSEN
jgi:hypothetical protein